MDDVYRGAWERVCELVDAYAYLATERGLDARDKERVGRLERVALWLAARRPELAAECGE
jgi:hypothetical protein